MFITELCWGHPVELLNFRKVHLGGDQNTWDVALHVMLLSKKQDKEQQLELREERIYFDFHRFLIKFR